jgi:hypothetical protein
MFSPALYQVLRVLVHFPEDLVVLYSITRLFRCLPLASRLLGPIDGFERGKKHSETVFHLRRPVSPSRDRSSESSEAHQICQRGGQLLQLSCGADEPCMAFIGKHAVHGHECSERLHETKLVATIGCPHKSRRGDRPGEGFHQYGQARDQTFELGAQFDRMMINVLRRKQ